MTAPEKMTPEEHTSAMTEPLEAMVPLMAGAMYFGPTALCADFSEGAGEPLTDVGREFAALIYHLTTDAHRAAWGAVCELDHKGDLYKKADKVLDRMTLCLLFARALMAPDLPSTLSGHNALERIRKESTKAYVTLTDRTLHALKLELTKT